MNSTLEAIATRFSCRSFTGNMPTEDNLHAILQAAIQAPSSINRQRWQVVLVKNAQLLDDMQAEAMGILASMEDKSHYERIQSRGGKLFYNAPCAAFIAIDTQDLAGSSLDCGIVAQNITLAAQSLRLGSCICGLARFCFEGNKADGFKQKLQFPAGYDFGIAVLLGEPTEQAPAHEPDQSKITIIE